MRTLSPLVNNLVISEAMYHIKGGHTVHTSGGKEDRLPYIVLLPQGSLQLNTRVSM